MAISNSPENLDRISNQDRPSELHSNLRRRRPNANIENEALPDSSSRTTNESDAGNSSEISEVDANKDRDQIGNGDGQKEKATSLSSNGQRTENGEGREQPQVDHVPVTFTYRPSTPAHRRIKESPLSSDAIFKQSHAGLFNLCIIVLVAVNSRLIIENLMKYGLLMSTGFWFSSRSLKDWPLFMCCLSLPIFPLGAFTVEKLRHHEFISESIRKYTTQDQLIENVYKMFEKRKEKDYGIYLAICLSGIAEIFSVVVVSLHIMITMTEMLYPVLMILRFDSAVLSGIILMLFTCIVWLKLVSYAHTNYDMRALTESIDKGSDSSIMDYSYDVSFKSLAYFMLAPTLCYQLSYPRTTCIRKGCVLRQLIKLVIFTGLMSFIIEQYINPIVQNSQHPLKGNLLNAIERVLKLSVPTLYVWLCMFYCFFHLWLNILAELLRFGDREFYKDWWNAKTAEEYWRMWNMPVHKWMVRHIYFPCLRNGIPKGVAVVIAFFISAIFHELCVGVPCHMIKFWAFMGIMLQVPLVLITNYLQSRFRNTMVGNMTFWFFFSIFGQPMCVLLYYHDVMSRKVRTE